METPAQSSETVRGKKQHKLRRRNTDYQWPFEKRGNYPQSAQQRLQPPLDQLPWWPLPLVLWEGSPDTMQALQGPSLQGVIRSGLPHALHHCSNAFPVLSSQLSAVRPSLLFRDFLPSAIHTDALLCSCFPSSS